jgi:signal transduction histidine kinase
MSILAIVITSNLAIRFGKLDRISRLKEKQHLEALEEILFITSHRVRKPVANIIGLSDLGDADRTLSAKDLKQRCQYLSSSAIELDTIIKELNNFIEQSERQNLSPVTVKPISHLRAAPQFRSPAKFEKVA